MRPTMIAIREFQKSDWPAVQKIYQQGIDTKLATFQEKSKTWAEWDSSTLPTCRLVAVIGGQVVGWAALSPVSSRQVYAGVAEVSIYISTGHRGRGPAGQVDNIETFFSAGAFEYLQRP